MQYVNSHSESNSQNNDELELHKKTVLKFFQDCKNNGLLCNAKPNSEILKNAITRTEISCLIDRAIEKIRQNKNSLKNNQGMPILSEKELDALHFSRVINFLRETTEELKISFQLIFNSNIATNTQHGVTFADIYKKLEYGPERKTEINMAFQIDLRNALSHQNYWYEHNNEHITSMTWNSSSGLCTWSQNDLMTSASKIICINTLVGKILDGDF